MLKVLDRNLTQEAMAGELGISVSTLKRELGKLNGLAEGVRGG
jgi:transcriptional regulator with XRE-family HTH domain